MNIHIITAPINKRNYIIHFELLYTLLGIPESLRESDSAEELCEWIF